ncbi:hypothetical protein FQR65_LT03876 [Abscondita terminalis]|nr:hypothetical protein FQR65_LT03876 [Abscondita terminalis]
MRFVIFLFIATVSARPQSNQFPERIEPYDFQYKVDHPPTNTYFGQNENGEPTGRVFGSYYVLLPDGRLLTVEYYVDGESGYVPKLTYQPAGRPLQR